MEYNKEYKNSIEINLCEILKGHKGKTFYSPIFGDITLEQILDRHPFSLVFDTENGMETFTSNGRFYDIPNSECLIFPSKDQRDWEKWYKENNLKTPKTLSEVEVESNGFYRLEYFGTDIYSTIDGETPIEKSAIALLKIYQLIEVGYGGVPSVEKRLNILTNGMYDIDIDSEGNFQVSDYALPTNHIAFHTKEQAEEFLSYSDNVQLLRDYFMI